MIHDRRLTESWSQLGASLRTAQAIGLHRDGKKLGLDPLQTEYRRRLWSYLYHADVYYSLILGRPPSISDAYCDAREPSNLELSELKPGEPAVSRPLTEPTTATYNILRMRFAKIIGKITFHFQKLHEPATFEDVEHLDKDLKAFIQDLPPHYRLENPDTSLDKTLDFIPIHRYNLATEILFVTITLHRPWLLRKLKSDKFALSRRACFDAAKMDFKIRKRFKQQYSMSNNMYPQGQFRAFNTAMIAGISAIIFPHNDDATEMRAIMATFLEDHPIDKHVPKDQTTQKETAIIYTLYRRALQVLENNDLNTGGHPRESVEVLLGLREGSGSTNSPSNVRPHNAPVVSSTSALPAYHSDASSVSLLRSLYASLVDNNAITDGNAHTTDRANAQRQLAAQQNLLGAASSGQPSAPFQPLSLSGNVKQQQPRGSGSSAGQQDGRNQHRLDESPVSNNSHEEDNPQRLLDQWLSANNVMSVGNFGDQNEFMFNQEFGFAAPGVDEFGLMDTMWNEPSISPNTGAGAAAALDMTGSLKSRHQVPQQDTFHGISDRMAQAVSVSPYPQEGPMLPQNPSPVPPHHEQPMGGDPGFSLDDTYWNALIDGESPSPSSLSVPPRDCNSIAELTLLLNAQEFSIQPDKQDRHRHSFSIACKVVFFFSAPLSLLEFPFFSAALFLSWGFLVRFSNDSSGSLLYCIVISIQICFSFKCLSSLLA